ncbi:MAG: M24 family metallopeptidase [Nonlabens sp.]
MEEQIKSRNQLIRAEKIASDLFNLVLERDYIRPGLSEKELNQKIYHLAHMEFGIQKYWHKRIVRAGSNTLQPYKENPENLILQEDDIIFMDMGPIVEDWEADFGRTYVLGKDHYKLKLAADVAAAWYEANNLFKKRSGMTGSELYQYCQNLATSYGWELGGQIAGHLVGKFPHEKLDQEIKTNYIHPDNHLPLSNKGLNGNHRNWIIEIHFIDRTRKIGGFFEQLAG